MLAEKLGMSARKNVGGRRRGSENVAKAVYTPPLEIHASQQWLAHAGLAFLQQRVGLRRINNVARKQDYSAGLNTGEQIRQLRRHFRAVEANDEKLADSFRRSRAFFSRRAHLGWIRRRIPRLAGEQSDPVSYCTCFFNSASKFRASSGVKLFRSTAYSFSSTGCESGVKMVSCAARGAGESPAASCALNRDSASSCSASTSRARRTTSSGSPASLATSMP